MTASEIDIERIRAEIDNSLAETFKLRAEAEKYRQEAEKLRHEAIDFRLGFWIRPVIAAATILGAGAGFTALIIRFFFWPI